MSSSKSTHFQKVVYNWFAVAGLVPKYTIGHLQPTKKFAHQSKSNIAPVNQGGFVVNIISQTTYKKSPDNLKMQEIKKSIKSKGHNSKR
jgi:hypothetical protein